MRRVPAANERPRHGVGSSKRDFLSLPATVKDDMGNCSRSRAVRWNGVDLNVGLVAEGLKTAERDYEEHDGKSTP